MKRLAGTGDGPPADPAPSPNIDVLIVRLPNGADLPLPTYATAGSAGLDLVAAVDAYAPVHLAAGAHVLIKTGLSIALPHGYEAQVRPRSGLALKHGITVLNSPGTIDADYRGELQVILINHGREPFVVRRGERIAQLVIAPVVQARLVLDVRLDQTERGAGGFGSTGTAPLNGAGGHPASSAATAGASAKRRSSRRERKR